MPENGAQAIILLFSAIASVALFLVLRRPLFQIIARLFRIIVRPIARFIRALFRWIGKPLRSLRVLPSAEEKPIQAFAVGVAAVAHAFTETDQAILTNLTPEKIPHHGHLFTYLEPANIRHPEYDNAQAIGDLPKAESFFAADINFREPRTMTTLSSVRPPLQRDGHFRC